MKVNTRFIFMISPNSSQNEKYFMHKLQRKSKHQFYAQYTFFENCTAYETMWRNMVQSDRPQMTIRGTVQRMRIACWITKTTNTHSEYVIITVFLLQQWLRESASILRLYIHCKSCLRYVVVLVKIREVRAKCHS